MVGGPLMLICMAGKIHVLVGLNTETPRDDAACAGEEVHHKSNGELSCLTAGDLTKTLGDWNVNGQMDSAPL